MDALLRVRDSGSHPNICRLKENFEQRGNYYLVLDLVSGGEMFDHLAANGAVSAFHIDERVSFYCTVTHGYSVIVTHLHLQVL